MRAWTAAVESRRYVRHCELLQWRGRATSPGTSLFPLRFNEIRLTIPLRRSVYALSILATIGRSLFRGSPRFDTTLRWFFSISSEMILYIFYRFRRAWKFCRRILKINFIGTYMIWWISTNSKVLGWTSIGTFKEKSLGNCEHFWRLYFTVLSLYNCLYSVIWTIKLRNGSCETLRQKFVSVIVLLII